MLMAFLSPFDNFSAIIRVASIPFLAKNKIKISTSTNKINTKNAYHDNLYSRGKKKATTKSTMLPKSK
jgi:hypothetical protein